MKIKTLLATTFVGLGCFLLAGCQPQNVSPVEPSVAPNSVIPSTIPETAVTQTSVCGRLLDTQVASITGLKVAPPTVNTIESITGAKRHVCTYNKAGDPATAVAYLNVTNRTETSAESFQQLWTNQQEAQKAVLTPVTGIGTEAFMGQVDNQPVLYLLLPDAQYWIKMGPTTQNAARQTEMLKEMAQVVAAGL